MPWGLAAVAAVGVGGSIISGNKQAGAAQDAAAAQEQAAVLQSQIAANTYNASNVMNLPTRELGGLAQQREAQLLGLTPNLDISPDFSTPNISVDPSSVTSGMNWQGPGANSVQNILNPPTPGAVYNPVGGSFSGNGWTGTSASNGLVPNPSGGMSQTIPGGGAMGGSGIPIQAQPAQPGMSANAFNAYPATGPNSAGGTALSPGGASTGYYTGLNMPADAGSSLTPGGTSGSTSGGYGSLMNPYDPSTFFMDPSYNFNLQQGQLGINRSAAAGGQLYSGAALKDAVNYASGMASNEFGNAYNRSITTQQNQYNMLQGAINGGQVANSQAQQAGQNFSSAASSAAGSYGNASAAGSIGSANAFSNMTNGITNSIGGAVGMYNSNNNFNNYLAAIGGKG